MTRLRTMWWPYVRYDCDGIDGEGECLHRYEDDGWGYSVEFCEHDKPWRILRIHGWTHYSHDGWTHHRCGHCNQDMTEAMEGASDAGD